MERVGGACHAPGVDYSNGASDLTWAEVAPRRHAFDARSAPAVVRKLAPASAASWAARRSDDAWADAMARAVVERFGRWAGGWRWAMDEGDFGGGPVAAWCCARHSVSGRDDTLKRVSDALVEWRGWLEDLDERFDRFPLAGLPAADEVAVWERGAVHLIHHVVDRTGAGDAWYGHCAQVLTWYLTRWGVAEKPAERLVEKAIGGRFDSWTGPDEALVGDVADQLARSVGGRRDARRGRA
jgi:hypothetical protein